MLTEVLPSLYETPGEFPFKFNRFQSHAYLLKRPEGNLVVYASSLFETLGEEVRAHGGVTAQFLSHWDEASPGVDSLRARFGATAHGPKLDRKVIERTCKLDHVFEGDVRIAPDFEVWAAPGHTPGCSAFLWKGPDARVLFIGDTINPDEAGVWRTFLTPFRRRYRDQVADSLQRLRALEFDLLIPAGSESGSSHEFVDPTAWRAIVDDCVARLRGKTWRFNLRI